MRFRRDLLDAVDKVSKLSAVWLSTVGRLTKVGASLQTASSGTEFRVLAISGFSSFRERKYISMVALNAGLGFDSSAESVFAQFLLSTSFERSFNFKALILSSSFKLSSSAEASTFTLLLLSQSLF